MATRQSALEKRLKEAARLLEKNCYTVIPPAEPVNVDVTELNKRKLEARRQAFVDELAKYKGTYPDEMLRGFYFYWSEANKSFTKMRFEMQKTFQIDLRLKTWYNNDLKRYGRKQVTTEQARQSKLAEILTD